jgi:hypothetical protein
MKNGVVQNWGLVEFSSWESAEATADLLDGHTGLGSESRLRVHYAVPGVPAINIYMSFVSNPLDNVRANQGKALLQTKPDTKVKCLSREVQGFNMFCPRIP